MSGRRPERPIFFVDRSLGGRIVPESLASAGLLVERLDDHFQHDATDTEWLSAVGARGWIVLTRDQNLRRNLLERNALVAARLRVFVVRAKGRTGQQVADILLARVPTLLDILARLPGPFVAHVKRDGVRFVKL